MPPVALVFAGFRTLVHVRHVGALGFGWQMDYWRPETWTRLMTEGYEARLAQS